MTTDPMGPVTIGMREIYNAVQEIKGQMALMIQQLSTVSKDQDDHEQLATDRHKDHEDRIRVVERRVWALPSAAVLLAAGALVVGIIQLVNS